MRNKILKYLSASLILTSLLFVSCDDTDDFQNDSTLDVVIPSVTLDYTHGAVTNLIETNMKYPFSVSIAQPVGFDVVLKVDVVGGTATRGDDFEIPNEIAIRAGSTTASGFIEVFEDDLIEEMETVTLSIGGRTINGASNALETTFNISNLTSDDLGIDLSWSLASTTTDSSGDEISPTNFADLRLLISTSPNNIDVITEADGGSFESTLLEASTPDGEYYIVSDFYAANEDITRDINLSVNFSRLGVFNGPTYDFANALNSSATCSEAYFVLAKVTKVGSDYTIESIGEASAPPAIEGTYDVVSNGSSTDGGAENNPSIDFATTVSIVDNGDGTYTLSDGWAGIYIAWYAVYGNTLPEPQTFSMGVCDNGAFSAEWTGIFGGAQKLSAQVNPDGTISVEVSNSWGDSVVQTYTPQTSS